MKRNKLFFLLASLTAKEMRQFKKMVVREGAPPMIKLIEFLEHNLKIFDADAYDELREKALRKINKSVPTDQNKRRLLSTANKLLSNFLVQQELTLNEQTNEELLQKQYLRRGLNKLYESSLKNTQETLLQNTTRDFHFQQSQLNINLKTYYYVTNKYKEKDILNGLKEIHKSLDLGYVMAKLHYACEVKMVQLVRGESFPVELLDELRINTRENNYFDHPIIQLYNNILILIEQPNSEAYQQLKKNWLFVIPMLSEEVKHQVFIIFLNLSWISCTDRRTQEMFELYRFGLTSNILINQGKITSSHFNNIVDLGSGLGYFAEVRTFINDYSQYLDSQEDTLDNIKTLYEAFLLFGEGKHDDALRQSIFLEFNDVSYGLRAYLLMLKCLYESKKAKGFKEIELRCEAFKQYLQRKFKQGLINKQTKQENMNFIKIVRQLPLASTSRFATISQQTLLKKLKATQFIISKTWLLKKIEGLS